MRQKQITLQNKYENTAIVYKILAFVISYSAILKNDAMLLLLLLLVVVICAAVDGQTRFPAVRQVTRIFRRVRRARQRSHSVAHPR
jgi:hypothetical protein